MNNEPAFTLSELNMLASWFSFINIRTNSMDTKDFSLLEKIDAAIEHETLRDDMRKAIQAFDAPTPAPAIDLAAVRSDSWNAGVAVPRSNVVQIQRVGIGQRRFVIIPLTGKTELRILHLFETFSPHRNQELHHA